MPKPRKPRKPRQHLEHTLQVHVASYLELASLGQSWWWTSIDHGVNITPTQRKLLAARGVKAGIPDILIVHQGQLHGIELKSPDGEMSKSQVDVALALRDAGAASYSIARSLDDVEALLHRLGIPTSARVAA